MLRFTKTKIIFLACALAVALLTVPAAVVVTTAPVYAKDPSFQCARDPNLDKEQPDNKDKDKLQTDCYHAPSHACGSGDDLTPTSIDLGCKGDACVTSGSTDSFCKGDHSAIMDATFGIIRFLTNGVGFIIVASLIVGGIQFSASGGDPQARTTAIKRLTTIGTALLIYIFAYAILNYILPKGFLS